MPGVDSYVQGAQPVEYVPESTYNQEVGSPNMKWIGMVQSFSVSHGFETNRIQTDTTGDNSVIEEKANQLNRKSHQVDVDFIPQDFDFLEYFMWADGQLSDQPNSIQFGEQNEDAGEYRRLLGCVGLDWSFSVSRDSAAEVGTTLMCTEETGWGGTDYAGSHASENTSSPLTFEDVTDVSYAGSSISDAIQSIGFRIRNDVRVYYDTNSTLETEISAVMPIDREITVSITPTYDDMSIVDKILSFDPQPFNFACGSDSFTFLDVTFDGADYEYGTGSLVGSTLTSNPASDLSMGSITVRAAGGGSV